MLEEGPINHKSCDLQSNTSISRSKIIKILSYGAIFYYYIVLKTYQIQRNKLQAPRVLDTKPRELYKNLEATHQCLHILYDVSLSIVLLIFFKKF